MDEKLKESLQEDLNNQNTAETVQSFIEDLELTGDEKYEDIINKAKAKLESLTAQVNVPVPPLDDMKQRLEEKGGTPETLGEKVVEVNTELKQNEEEIQKVEPEAVQKIQELSELPKEKEITEEAPVEIPPSIEETNIVTENQTVEKQGIPENGPASSVQDMEEFLVNRETYGKELKPYEQLRNFLQQKYSELAPDSEEYKTKWNEMVSANEFIQTKKHPFVSEKYPNLSQEEYKKNKSEIMLGATKYNFTEKARKDIDEIEKSKQEDKPYISIGGKFGHKDLADITPEFIAANPDFKQSVIERLNDTGNGDIFTNNAIGENIKSLLEKGVISEEDIVSVLKNRIQERVESAKREDAAGRYEGQYGVDSRNYFLGKIPTDLLEKLVKTDKSFSEEIEYAAKANERTASQVADNAKVEDPIWLKNNQWYLFHSTANALRYQKILGSYDYENNSKKYGPLVNKSLDNMIKDKYENQIISDRLSDERIIPKLIETNVLSKDRILSLYNSSIEKEENLNDATVQRRIGDAKNLVKLGILNKEEGLALANKYIEKLRLAE